VTFDAFWLLLYTIVICVLAFNFGRLSTVGHPLRKAPRAPRSPVQPLSSPPPAQDPTPALVVAPTASQEVKAPETTRFSWNPDCPMCGKPDKVVMATEDAFQQTWHCYPCNHWWRT
jgi:hypothetical protein